MSGRGRCHGPNRTSAVACIIRSGPQMKATAFAPVPGGAVEQLGHDPDPTEPVRSGPVDRLLDLDVVRAPASRPISSTYSRSAGVRAPR